MELQATSTEPELKKEINETLWHRRLSPGGNHRPTGCRHLPQQREWCKDQRTALKCWHSAVISLSARARASHTAHSSLPHPLQTGLAAYGCRSMRRRRGDKVRSQQLWLKLGSWAVAAPSWGRCLKQHKLLETPQTANVEIMWAMRTLPQRLTEVLMMWANIPEY